MEMLVFAVLAALVVGFLVVLSVMGVATLHAVARLLLPVRRPVVTGGLT